MNILASVSRRLPLLAAMLAMVALTFALASPSTAGGHGRGGSRGGGHGHGGGSYGGKSYGGGSYGGRSYSGGYGGRSYGGGSDCGPSYRGGSYGGVTYRGGGYGGTYCAPRVAYAPRYCAPRYRPVRYSYGYAPYPVYYYHRPRISFAITFASGPPPGYYYYDPYCDERFTSLDLYLSHAHGCRHPCSIEAVSYETGDVDYTYAWDGDSWECRE